MSCGRAACGAPPTMCVRVCVRSRPFPFASLAPVTPQPRARLITALHGPEVAPSAGGRLSPPADPPTPHSQPSPPPPMQQRRGAAQRQPRVGLRLLQCRLVKQGPATSLIGDHCSNLALARAVATAPSRHLLPSTSGEERSDSGSHERSAITIRATKSHPSHHLLATSARSHHDLAPIHRAAAAAGHHEDPAATSPPTTPLQSAAESWTAQRQRQSCGSCPGS